MQTTTPRFTSEVTGGGRYDGSYLIDALCPECSTLSAATQRPDDNDRTVDRAMRESAKREKLASRGDGASSGDP